MEYSNKRKQINSTRSIGNERTAVNSGAQDPAYQAYLQAVLSGRAKADSNTMGHRQDLAPSLAAKMSKAFGMDLSQMKLYRSGAMEGTETKGMASGNNIVLSKDIDLNTMAGQAVLGHEISHVRSQSQGIGMGHSGLYQNAGLEHQADVEGMMAARGQSILGESTGMDMGLGMGSIGGLTPLGSGMSASAGAPMQAKGKGKKNKKSNAKTQKKAVAPKQKPAKKQKGKSWQEVINSVSWKKGDDDLTFEEYDDIVRDNCIDNVKKVKMNGGEYEMQKGAGFNDNATRFGNGNDAKADADKFREENPGFIKRMTNQNFLGDPDMARINIELRSSFGNYFSDDEKENILRDLQSTDREKYDEARLLLKERLLQAYENNEKKYGKLLEQMDLEHISSLGGMKGLCNDLRIGESAYDITGNNVNKGISFTKGKRKDKKEGNLTPEELEEEKRKDLEFYENAKTKDEKFELLYSYYDATKRSLMQRDTLDYQNGTYAQDWQDLQRYHDEVDTKEIEKQYEEKFGFTGPEMSKEALDEYKVDITKWKKEKHKGEVKKLKRLYPKMYKNLKVW